jgi:hypothetical protein
MVAGHLREQVVGKMATGDLFANEPLLTQNLVTPDVVTQQVALSVPQGKNVVSVPTASNLISNRLVRPGVQVALNERAGALPDAVGHGVVVDLLTQGYQVLDVVPGDEGQGGLAGGVDVLGLLASGHPEHRLPPREPHQVPGGEQVAGGQPAGEVVDRRAAHQRVVHVEEGGSGAGRIRGNGVV